MGNSVEHPCMSRRDELRLAVALTRCPFNNSNPVQLQILQTIYKQLTGDIFDCPRF